MRRHGVPDASGSEPCEPHHQLATPGSLQVNEFRYFPHVRRFRGAKCNLCLFGRPNELCRMRRMSRITQKIELRRVRRIAARKYYFFVSTANVESIQPLQLICNTVDFDHAGTADIQNAKFAALGEVRCLERIVGRQEERLASGYRRADHGAVKINIRQSDLSRMKKIVEQKRIAQFLGGQGSIAENVRHLQHSHSALLSFWQAWRPLSSLTGVVALRQ